VTTALVGAGARVAHTPAAEPLCAS